MRRALAISGLLFLLGGIAGFVFTFKNFTWGSGGSLQGVTTFGTFVAVGIGIFASLIAADYED